MGEWFLDTGRKTADALRPLGRNIKFFYGKVKITALPVPGEVKYPDFLISCVRPPAAELRIFRRDKIYRIL